ncbi:MAG: hypothetical protein SNJ72_04995 [Fimbriimonadales bacterium]
MRCFADAQHDGVGARNETRIRHPEPQAKGLDEMLHCVQHDEGGARDETRIRHPEPQAKGLNEMLRSRSA